MSASNYLEQKLLEHVFKNTSYTSPTTVYVKLHTGDPGEDCTANAAGNTTRLAATFGAAVNPAGTISITSTITWTSVSTTETYSYISIWDASTAGNPLASGPMDTAHAVTAGDTFNLTALTVTLN